VKVAGHWRYVYRAIDQFGQVIDVFVSARRDAKAARRFFDQAIIATKVTPIEVTTDQAPVYPAVLEDLLPAAWHRTDQYANNGIECDHGRLKARRRAMRGLKQDHSAKAVVVGMPSCRTFGMAITNWRSRSQRTGEWPWRSKNWPCCSDARGDHGFSPPCAGATQQRPSAGAHPNRRRNSRNPSGRY
jgi:transposase-like protein